MRPLVLFYILVFYVLLQFGWWSYLLVNLNREVYELKYQNQQLQGINETLNEQELQDKIRGRLWMVAGEGSVFLILLIIGVNQIRKAFAKEVALAQRQRNFLLSVTHEFKTPIASLRLYLQTLQKYEMEKEKRSDLLGKAITDTDRLNQLVENMLVASMIEEKNFSFHMEPVNLSALLSDTLQKIAPLNVRQLTLTTEAPPEVYIAADKPAMASLMTNLLENAMKYSPDHSTVKATLSQANGQVSFKVTDEGSGIPDEEKEKIFEKFYRVGSEETRRTKGTGLGLFIVKHIAEAHRGKVFVHNNVPRGTVFEVIFPS